MCKQSRNSSTTKTGEHIIPCGDSISTIWTFDHIENKHTLYHGKDCTKKFWESWREQTENIIDSEKTTMLPLTKEELKSY